MLFIDKIYSLEKDVDFKEFVESLGIPEDKKEEVLNDKPSQTLKKYNDQYILCTTVPAGGNKVLRFYDGVELDEEVAPGYVAKTKFTIEGNVVTQNQTFSDGLSITYRREYSADQLVVVITTNKWNGTCRRYYKAD